eukprot:TRINITY_DN24689_c0_g1_i4.p2 TRINITY_DN24689_c0_g1~~TRINITY_DN24689_c0_g1_i4.p2  ORF type:complete len:141 (+),score=31.98 TRINITY_DN24689_c0_g1_i4:131-553(+)
MITETRRAEEKLREKEDTEENEDAPGERPTTTLCLQQNLVGSASDAQVQVPHATLRKSVFTICREMQPKAQLYELHARSWENFEKPFLWLARRLGNQPRLEFAAIKGKAPEEMVAAPVGGLHRHREILEMALQTPIKDAD